MPRRENPAVHPDGETQFLCDVFPSELQVIARRRAHYGLPPMPQAAASGAQLPEAPDGGTLAGLMSNIRDFFVKPALKHEEADAPAATRGLIGLAFSGGGVRSATFNLGVTQSLLKNGLLKRIDYLSTVSGGGYIGSCISSLLNSKAAGGRKVEADASSFPLAAPRGNTEAPSLRTLRNVSSSYIRPKNAAEAVRMAALVLRGLILNACLFFPYVVWAAVATHVFFKPGIDAMAHGGRWGAAIFTRSPQALALLFCIVVLWKPLEQFLDWWLERSMGGAGSRRESGRTLMTTVMLPVTLAVGAVLLFESLAALVVLYGRLMPHLRSLADAELQWSPIPLAVKIAAMLMTRAPFWLKPLLAFSPLALALRLARQKAPWARTAATLCLGLVPVLVALLLYLEISAWFCLGFPPLIDGLDWCGGFTAMLKGDLGGSEAWVVGLWFALFCYNAGAALSDSRSKLLYGVKPALALLRIPLFMILAAYVVHFFPLQGTDTLIYDFRGLAHALPAWWLLGGPLGLALFLALRLWDLDEHAAQWRLALRDLCLGLAVFTVMAVLAMPLTDALDALQKGQFGAWLGTALRFVWRLCVALVTAGFVLSRMKLMQAMAARFHGAISTASRITLGLLIGLSVLGAYYGDAHGPILITLIALYVCLRRVLGRIYSRIRYKIRLLRKMRRHRSLIPSLGLRTGVALLALSPLLFWMLQRHQAAAAVAAATGYAFDTNIYCLTLCAIFLWYAVFLFVDVNSTSLHRIYRDQLARAYLFILGPDKRQRPNTFQKLSALNLNDNAPYHLINTTLNLQASRAEALNGRSSTFFMFSKNWCGGCYGGFRDTQAMERDDLALDLGTALAISGAAASPNMGLQSSGPLVPFLTMLNLRLGYWIPNPRPEPIAHFLRSLSPRLGRVGYPYLFREMFSLLNEKSLYLNLSDGGHLENLGAYELLRRRCKLIIACDAEADPDMSFGSMANLLRFASIDFGIDIDIKLDPLRKDAGGFSPSHAVLGTIHYDGKDKPGGETGYLLYIKASYRKTDNEIIRGYKAQHPDFPHESTADQFFD